LIEEPTFFDGLNTLKELAFKSGKSQIGIDETGETLHYFHICCSQK